FLLFPYTTLFRSVHSNVLSGNSFNNRSNSCHSATLANGPEERLQPRFFQPCSQCLLIAFNTYCESRTNNRCLSLKPSSSSFFSALINAVCSILLLVAPYSPPEP